MTGGKAPNNASLLRNFWLLKKYHGSYRVLGYSSDKFYVAERSIVEPMGRESLQNIWKRYKVDISFYGRVNTTWSLYKDRDFGFVKMNASNQSSFLFEYDSSNDGKVYDSFSISVDYKDVLACVHDRLADTKMAESRWRSVCSLEKSASEAKSQM